MGAIPEARCRRCTLPAWFSGGCPRSPGVGSRDEIVGGTPMARHTESADLTLAPLESLDRLSLNQITTNLLNMDDAIAACESHGIPWIAAWRHKLDQDVPAIRRRIDNAGLRVSSLCRGG